VPPSRFRGAGRVSVLLRAASGCACRKWMRRGKARGAHWVEGREYVVPHAVAAPQCRGNVLLLRLKPRDLLLLPRHTAPFSGKPPLLRHPFRPQSVNSKNYTIMLSVIEKLHDYAPRSTPGPGGGRPGRGSGSAARSAPLRAPAPRTNTRVHGRHALKTGCCVQKRGRGNGARGPCTCSVSRAAAASASQRAASAAACACRVTRRRVRGGGGKRTRLGNGRRGGGICQVRRRGRCRK